jgi:hypothetical protein
LTDAEPTKGTLSSPWIINQHYYKKKVTLSGPKLKKEKA